MKKATEILSDMIALLTYYLDNDLSNIDKNSAPFAYGEKTAYVECLEMISEWKKAQEHGLDFQVEKRFPL